MYKYKIEECDVLDKVKLEVFREKRLEWIDWLGGKDYHSILGQIHDIVWYDAIFRVIDKARKITFKQNCKDFGINYDITRLIDSGNVVLMTTAIRRLIENPKKDPKLAIVSLRRVITDIKENRNIITREIYVGYDGLPYDPEFARSKWLENNPMNDGVRGGWLETTGPNAWSESEILHSNFDRISNKLPKVRSREDLIEEKIFESLGGKLNSCHDIKKYVDKFIAHAADINTRINLTDEQRHITLARISEALKTVYQVTSFLYSILLWESSIISPLATPQYNHLEDLDKRWISYENINEIYDFWDEHKRKLDDWNKDLWIEF